LNGEVPRNDDKTAVDGDSGAHFALMDKVYRRQRYFYDFTRRYYLLGRDRLIRELGAQKGERVVEVGCGTARNLIRIARAYSVELYGLDASSEMLRSARASIARAGMESRISLACGLAEDLDPAQFGLSAPFDHIVFSYSLSMIPDWRWALAAAGRNLTPAGRVHVVDFGDFRRLNPLFAKGLRRWLRLFHVAPREELLGAIERAGEPDSSTGLRVLPGRYSFLWSGTAEDLQRLARRPVA
jgi:S-adenosylmethionine-diacylgycerolhomoserine-N-methlytransferase